jgi:hypothetical protein
MDQSFNGGDAGQPHYKGLKKEEEETIGKGKRGSHGYTDGPGNDPGPEDRAM